MFGHVDIRGFRAFSHLELEGLTRVNLIVGRNGSGKTSVLEAMEVLAGGGHPSTVLQSPWRRDELVPDWPDDRPPTETGGSVSYLPDVRRLFHGHRLDVGAALDIQCPEAPTRFARCELVRLDGSGVSVAASAESTPTDVLFSGSEIGSPAPLPLGGSGQLRDLANLSRQFGRSPKQPSVVFHTTRAATDMWTVLELWSDIVLGIEEEYALELIRVVEPDIEKMAVSGARIRGRLDFFVRLRGQAEKVPIGSLGEGAWRLLLLSLSLARSKGGLLLVDEIDTGLHHRVLSRVWEMVIEGAKRLDVQVFATSHSGDCVEALADVVRDRPDLAPDVSLHRIEREPDRAVRYDAEELVLAKEHLMELRG